MLQAAQSLLRKHPTRSYGTNPAVRCSLAESQRRAVFEVAADAFRKQSFPMALMHRDDVLQQISPTTFHPALRYTIVIGETRPTDAWNHSMAPKHLSVVSTSVLDPSIRMMNESRKRVSIGNRLS